MLVSVVSVVVPGSGRPGLGFGRLTSPCMTGHMGPVHTIVISRAKAVEVGGCCLSRGWSWGGFRGCPSGWWFVAFLEASPAALA